MGQGQQSSQPSASPDKTPTRREALLAELNKVLNTFLHPEQTFDYVPAQLKKYRKKKRQKRL